MRHGRKNKTKAFNGYKRHLAVNLDAPLILDAHARPANEPENESAKPLLDAAANFGQLVEVYIDRGYLGSPIIMELHRAGVDVRCRPWPKQQRPGKFGRDAFVIDLRRKVVRCPAGEEARITKANSAHFGGRCHDCDLASKCTDAKGGRTFNVSPQESLLRKLRKQKASKHGRERLRLRVAVEHRLARLGQFQGRTARYKGERKNTLDVRRHSAVANLRETQTALAA